MLPKTEEDHVASEALLRNLHGESPAAFIQVEKKVALRQAAVLFTSLRYLKFSTLEVFGILWYFSFFCFLVPAGGMVKRAARAGGGRWSTTSPAAGVPPAVHRVARPATLGQGNSYMFEVWTAGRTVAAAQQSPALRLPQLFVLRTRVCFEE